MITLNITDELNMTSIPHQDGSVNKFLPGDLEAVFVDLIGPDKSVRGNLFQP